MIAGIKDNSGCASRVVPKFTCPVQLWHASFGRRIYLFNKQVVLTVLTSVLISVYLNIFAVICFISIFSKDLEILAKMTTFDRIE